MEEGIIITLTRDHTYPTPEEQVYLYSKSIEREPWSDSIAASVKIAPEVWQMLGSPEYIRAVIRRF